MLCKTLNVSRSGYYAWRGRSQSNRDTENAKILERIQQIYAKSRKTYGSPRIHAALVREGVKCGRNRVARLMRRSDIVPEHHRRFKRNMPFKGPDVVAENLLQRNFNTPAPNRAWVSDITCFWTRKGWLYLAVVIDLYSRKVIGWSMQGSMVEDLPKDALNMAISNRMPQGNLIHHSDQGAQYKSYAFREVLEKNGIRYSLSHKGNCYDNAVAESFFKTLKTELNPEEHFRDREDAKNRLFEYIEVFYNRQRLHSTLGYLSPQEFEAQKESLISSVH